MYGLLQARRLAFNDLGKHLDPYGHAPVQCTSALWTKKQNINLLSLLMIFEQNITN